MSVEDEPGSVAIKNPNHEQFAQLSAAGLSQTEAYKNVYGEFAHAQSAGNNGYRLARHPAVRARVKWLRKAQLATHAAEDEEITRGGLMRLMDDVTTALMQAADAAQRAGASPGECQKIRKALTVHAGRVACLTPQKQARQEAPTDLDLAGPSARLRRCTCQR